MLFLILIRLQYRTHYFSQPHYRVNFRIIYIKTMHLKEEWQHQHLFHNNKDWACLIHHNLDLLHSLPQEDKIKQHLNNHTVKLCIYLRIEFQHRSSSVIVATTSKLRTRILDTSCKFKHKSYIYHYIFSKYGLTQKMIK